MTKVHLLERAKVEGLIAECLCCGATGEPIDLAWHLCPSGVEQSTVMPGRMPDDLPCPASSDKNECWHEDLIRLVEVDCKTGRRCRIWVLRPDGRRRTADWRQGPRIRQ